MEYMIKEYALCVHVLSKLQLQEMSSNGAAALSRENSFGVAIKKVAAPPGSASLPATKTVLKTANA